MRKDIERQTLRDHSLDAPASKHFSLIRAASLLASTREHGTHIIENPLGAVIHLQFAR